MSSCYAPLLAVFSVLVVFAVVRVAGDHGDGGATGDPNGTTTTTEDAGAAGFDVHREWDTLSEKLSLVVNGALDQVLPELTRVVPTLELSTDCLLSLFRVIGGVRKLDLNSVRSESLSNTLSTKFSTLLFVPLGLGRETETNKKRNGRRTQMETAP